jgi:hypothetical protein
MPAGPALRVQVLLEALSRRLGDQSPRAFALRARKALTHRIHKGLRLRLIQRVDVLKELVELFFLRTERIQPHRPQRDSTRDRLARVIVHEITGGLGGFTVGLEPPDPPSIGVADSEVLDRPAEPVRSVNQPLRARGTFDKGFGVSVERALAGRLTGPPGVADRITGRSERTLKFRAPRAFGAWVMNAGSSTPARFMCARIAPSDNGTPVLDTSPFTGSCRASMCRTAYGISFAFASCPAPNSPRFTSFRSSGWISFRYSVAADSTAAMSAFGSSITFCNSRRRVLFARFPLFDSPPNSFASWST